MNKLIIVLIIIFGIQIPGFSQNNENKEFGVTILNIDKSYEFKPYSSTLIIFKGNTHLINNFLDLEKHIKRTFRKKSKKHNLEFNFELSSEKSYGDDLKKVPSKKYDPIEFDIVCEIYLLVSEIKSSAINNIDERNQIYNLYVTFKNNVEKTTITEVVLEVKSLGTITSQNKNIAKAISETILK
ncbi:hypothetical protein [Psychroserpens sp. Hel_I_66]|uniref:hypothetical protein n=1 Tax=Psychroserpens sp. Hel_I_66 TaxID=1250004 RepID=UPI0006486647|nr:hypothetical protein [Psychroserpens sp. Hel_I_66]